MSAELDRVRQYRRATRIAVQADDHGLQDRYLALMELAEAARAEADPFVRTWSERAIWEESRLFLGVGDEDAVPPEPYEAAQRKLRARGFSQCPECRAPLATDADFKRWYRMRVDHIADLERREAVEG